MHRIILAVLLLTSTVELSAQKYSSAFEALEDKQYSKAIKQFDRAKKKLPTVANYGYALLYADSAYSDYSIIKAYRYAKYATGSFNRSKKKNQLRNDYGINEEKIADIRDSVALRAYKGISDKDNPDVLTQYISIFGESRIINDVIARRDSIAYAKAREKGGFRDYQIFALSYPDAKQAPKALEKFEQIWKSMYEEVLQTGEYFAIEKFQNQYRDFPFYGQYDTKHQTLAERGKNLSLEVRYMEHYRPKYNKFIKDAAPKDIAFVCLQVLLSPTLAEKNYQIALDTMTLYEEYFSEKPKQFNELKALLEAKTTAEYEESQLRGEINTSGWEYSASVTADDKQIVFCGRNRKDNLKPGLEDIFISRKKDGKWGAGTPVKELNTTLLNEAPLFISADGTRMLLFSEGNIYYSDKTAKGWGEKKVFPNISLHEAWDADAMLTADGNALFFISDREGSVGMPIKFGKKYHGGQSGNSDIYVSVKENETWSQPFNIGAVINTPYAERSPFLHPDMKTLYFSSDGHTGLGQKDVFMSKRLNDSLWTEWSEPINLGKSINTSGDEWGYKISGDGTKAYFSRFDGKVFNIYETLLPPEYRPETTTRIFGTITNTEGEILQSEIVWENLETQKEIGRSNSDPESGSYIISLPNGKNYGFYVQTPGYYPVSGNIDLTETKVMQEIEKNFVLISAKRIAEGDKAIPLENIFFEFNSHSLRKESFPELRRLSKFLKQYPDMKIEIAGHTDNVGSASYNKELSGKRAQAVRNRLIEEGIPAAKIQTKGYGAEQPIADNDTDDGRAKNRRVEFRIVD